MLELLNYKVIVSLVILITQCELRIFSAQSEASNVQPSVAYPIPKLWSTSGTGLVPAEWQACWIWQKGENAGDNLVLLARKCFNVETQPEKARLFITADCYYELYVNGLFINRGPARSAPHHQSYDILEIASVLKEGKNVLALRVFHKGRGAIGGRYQRPPLTATARPGVLAQLEIQSNGKQEIIPTNNSWRVKKPEWINPYTSGFGESTDFRKEEEGWQDVNFDDSQWGEARELLTDMFWPGPSPGERAKAITFPWLSLVARDIPYLNESLVRAKMLHEVGEIIGLSNNDPVAAGASGLLFPKEKNILNGFESYKKGEGALALKNSYPSKILSSDGTFGTYLIFDLGEFMHGYPRLEIEGDAGTVVEVLYATHLREGKFPLRTAIGPRPLTDRIILTEGRTVWDAIEMRDFRYLFIAFRNTMKPVNLYFAGINRADYPFERGGSFSVSKDDELNWLWRASVNTLCAVTTDAFTDNYREKRQYSQTSYYAARAGFAAFGDSYLQRRYLIQIAQEQENNGFLPVAAPKETPVSGGFLDGSVFWVMGLHDYFLHSGDTLTVLELLPNAESFLSLLRRLENKEGFIESPPFSYWIDHADLDRSGANFSLNALYLLAMQDFMEILRWIGKDEKADEYYKHISKLRLNMRKRFWEPDHKLFSDALTEGKLSGTFTEHSNSLAIVTGIATPEQEQLIIKEFLENNSARMVQSVLFMHYIAESLFMSGHGKEALSILKDRYRPMKTEGSQTLWENWTIKHDDCSSQAENAFPAYSLTRWLLGIQPTRPGMTEVILSCNLYGLQESRGSMPSPTGIIHVAWQKDKKGISLATEVPQGMNVKVDLKSGDLKVKKMLSVDGQSINVNTLTSGMVTITNGRHTLKFY